MERREYIKLRNGGFYVANTRVSLDSIVYSFKAGDSPETIRQNFLIRDVVDALILIWADDRADDGRNLMGEIPFWLQAKPEKLPLSCQAPLRL